MVDIQTVSIAIASASVVAGIIYYSLQIRNQTKARQTDLIVRLYSLMINKEWLDAWDKVINSTSDMTDWKSYRKKHGFSDWNMVYITLELFGILVENKLLKIDFFERTGHDQFVFIWEKMRPMIEDARRTLGLRQIGVGTEYLYNEMKKREQQAKIG